MILGILLAATVATSLLLGRLGKLSGKELMLQTMGMGIAAFAFYGLALLVEYAVQSH